MDWEQKNDIFGTGIFLPAFTHIHIHLGNGLQLFSQEVCFHELIAYNVNTVIVYARLLFKSRAEYIGLHEYIGHMDDYHGTNR